MSDSRIKGSVRTSQLVTTYGVGALIAQANESFIVAGIERWQVDEDAGEIHEPRLERQLGVWGFRTPPAGGDESWDIPVFRFPEQHSCPQCHRLDSLYFFKSPFGKATCNMCEDEPDLVPSRFVVACEDGHLDDFPFYRWVHDQHPHHDGNGKAKLQLKSRGESSGLKDIEIKCSCGARRSMDGAFGKKALFKVTRCQGRRPWLGADHKQDCDKTPVTLQRGASNVWFADTISAISIPPWSEGVYRLLDRYWKVLKNVPPIAIQATMEGMGVASNEHSLEDLVGATLQRKAVEAGESAPDSTEVKPQEYEALMKGAPEKDRHDEFVCLDAKEVGDEAATWVPVVKNVPKLRVVRVLRGFSRLQPPVGSSDPDEPTSGSVVPIGNDETGWLPAIEVSGEGVFLELSSDRLDQWEASPKVVSRAARLAERAEHAFGEVPDDISPRFIMIHTLAHALIDQWALECGYPAASLAERLYVTKQRAGLLIYTATTDSAGSLGGVVSMTEDGRLSASLREAMLRSSWCSADPLCIETATQGAEALNLAACHACALLPETSCEWRNQFLDRALLVGNPETPDLGYFTSLTAS